MQDLGLSVAYASVEPEPLYCVVCEDRPFLSILLGEWIQKTKPCRLEQISHPNCLVREHPAAMVCFLSTRLASAEGSILPKGSKAVAALFDDNFSASTARWWKGRGAKGLFDLRDKPEEWGTSLHALLQGQGGETPSAKRALEEGHENCGLHILTRREMEVAQHLVRGCSAAQVAKKLGTTQGTIKNQRKAVYEKLKIDRATQLPWAMGNGIGMVRW